MYDINCQTCVPAYALRLHGFDITAKGNIPGSMSEFLSRGDRTFSLWKNFDGSDPTISLLSDFMTQKGYLKMSPARYVEFFEESCKEVGIYELTIGWKGRGGHATVLQRLPNGKLVRIEPQAYSGNVYQSLSSLAENGALSGWNLRTRGIVRIDNKILDPKFLSIFNK